MRLDDYKDKDSRNSRNGTLPLQSCCVASTEDLYKVLAGWMLVDLPG